MPELPEVETVRTFLHQHLPNTTITEIEQKPLASKLRRPLSPLTGQIVSASFRSVNRRGKYLSLVLDNGLHIALHLGMTGRVLLADTPPEANPHNHIILKLKTAENQTQWLTYNDPRRFGFFLVHSGNEPPDFLEQLGAEPFDLSASALHDAIKNRAIPIKTILLNQQIIAGLGNIYISEALWLCSIHPLEKGTHISLESTQKLIDAICDTLRRAILAGGTTLRNYRKASGTIGQFQHCFNAYNQEGKTCSICNGSIQKIIIGGRSSYFCGQHQILAC